MATFSQYEKKNGTKEWMLRAYLGTDPLTGKRITINRRGFSTKKAAQLELNILQNNYANGDFTISSNQRTTVKELYELWFINYQTTVKQTTWTKTEYNINKYILPKFGKMYIDKIDVKTAQIQVNKWCKEFGMYTKLLGYLKRIMDYGVSLELIDSNPFRKIIVPKNTQKKQKKDKFKFYTKDELKIFLDSCQQHYNDIPDHQAILKYYAAYDCILFRFLAFTGCRIGEVLALKWEDINLTDKVIKINKPLTDVKGGYEIGTPKTKQSNRTITLDDNTITELKKWKLKQMELFVKIGTRGSDFVFSNPHGKTIARNNIYNRSNKIADRAGLHRLGNHGFRHTHASLLFEAGANFKDVQDRLGHSSINITMDIYTHVTKESKKITTERLVSYVGF